MLDVAMPFLAHILVPMFMVGMAGSAIVVVITLAWDMTDFLSDGGGADRSGEGLS